MHDVIPNNIRLTWDITPPLSDMRQFETSPNTMRYDCSLVAVDKIVPPLISLWTLDISLLSVYFFLYSPSGHHRKSEL